MGFRVSRLASRQRYLARARRLCRHRHPYSRHHLYLHMRSYDSFSYRVSLIFRHPLNANEVMKCLSAFEVMVSELK